MLNNKWLKWLVRTVGAVLVLWVLAWLLVPPLLKSQVQSRGSQALGRTLTVGAVDFKPWTLELTVTDLQIASADGKSPQLRIARLYADAEMQSLLRLAPVVDAITVDQPQIQLTHLGDGHYDIDDLLERFKPDPTAAPSAPLHFALHNLVLHDGSVDFTDHHGGAQRQHSLRKLQVSLPFLSNLDSQREVTVQPRLAFELNGSAFDSAAQATPFAQSRKGEANLTITHLDFAPYLPYLPASLPVQIKSAVLDTSLQLAFVQSPANKVTISGSIKLSGLQVDDRAGASLLSVESVQAVLAELRPLEQSIALESLTIDAPHLRLARNRAGALVLPVAAAKDKPAAPPAPAASSAANGAAPAAPGWQASLGKLVLQGGEVRFQDDSVTPALQLMLGEARMEVQDVQWPMDNPAHFEASASLQSPDIKKAKAADLHIQGEGTDASGTLHASLTDLALALAAPYAAQYLVPQVQGTLDANLDVHWNGGAIQLAAPKVALRDFALLPPAGNATLNATGLPAFKLLELNQLAVDPQRHSVSLAKLALHKPRVSVERDENGKWMFERWLKSGASDAAGAGPAAASAAPASDSVTPWSVKLAETVLDDGTVSLADRMPDKPVLLELSSVQARVKDLSLDGRKPLPVTLSAKLRTPDSEPGSLRFDGSVAWDPLVAQGTLEALQLPVHAVAPYAMRQLRLELLRADTSFKGQLRFASLPAGPEVQVRGDAAVEELKVNSFSLPAEALANATAKSARQTAPSEELLQWKALSVPGIEFNMAPATPMRLKVREVSLSDFFARLIVSPKGRLVLQDLVNPEDIGPPASAQAAPPQSQSSAPVAAAPAPSAMDPVIEMGPIKLINGRVAFSDRFIQPNYSASLTGLSGSLSGFKSQPTQGVVQMADLELRGRAEGMAGLEITGKLNPLSKPLALDIRGRVRDLELSPLSSYAIKYAGYGIERGKLSVDVNYSIAPDGKLQASNNIVLNQLVFGDAVPGAPNSLPVKLAVALLADSNGVIDLNVPISGSLNDPQFRVWPIVWKVVGNIITKALTAPFKLLAGLFGDGNGGDELSTVVFEPGTTVMGASGRDGLDKVAKALAAKPGLRLTVVGSAQLEREADAIKRDRLGGMLMAEKRRAAASAGKDVTAVAAVAEAEYPALLKEVYRRSDIKKPRNAIGVAKDLPTAEMEALLLDNLVVNEDAVRELALNRSVAVREYLTARQLPSDRIFLGVVKTGTAGADWQPRAELSIEQH